MGIGYYLQFGFAQHALEAAFLVAVSCGLIGPFVITRTMSFAVHGTSELAFTGAVGGLLVADNPLAGALVGALVVAALIGLLGQRAAERDSTIGVILAAGLGLGVFLLGYYHGYASEALNILFGNIFGISSSQILLLGVIAVLVAIVLSGEPLLRNIGLPWLPGICLVIRRPGGDGFRRFAISCIAISSSGMSMRTHPKSAWEAFNERKGFAAITPIWRSRSAGA